MLNINTLSHMHYLSTLCSICNLHTFSTFSRLLCLFAVLGWAGAANAFEYNDLEFYPVGDGCEVRGFGSSYLLPTSVNLHIPAYAYDEDGNSYPVTSIAKEAFLGHTEIVQLFVPSTVETIGAKAFSSCVNLRALTLYPSTKTIGSQAFFGCLSLLALNTSAELIGEEAFRGCIALSAVNLGAPMKRIEPGAFMGCLALTNIDIPHTVESIGFLPGYFNRNGVFEDCTQLRSVTFSYNLSDEIPCINSIGDNTFKNCVHLTELLFPYSLTLVYNDAFLRCTSLKHIEWGGPKAIRVYPVDLEGVPLQSFEHHGDVRWDRTDNLKALTSLEEISYDTYATEVQPSLYRNITSLKTVVLNHVTKIGSNAFNGCTGLSNVALSAELTEIATGAFTGCTSLSDLKFGANVTAVYDCLSKSGITSLTIPDNVTTFTPPSDCERLTSVTIGDGVKACSGGNFSGCNALSYIRFGRNVNSVNVAPAGVRTIVCANPVPPVARNFHNDVYNNCSLIVPVGAAADYRKAQNWKRFGKISEADMGGIDGISADAGPDTSVRIVDGSVEITTDGPTAIYTADGKQVEALGAGTHILTLDRGIYIVVSPSGSRKFAL